MSTEPPRAGLNHLSPFPVTLGLGIRQTSIQILAWLLVTRHDVSQPAILRPSSLPLALWKWCGYSGVGESTQCLCLNQSSQDRDRLGVIPLLSSLTTPHPIASCLSFFGATSTMRDLRFQPLGKGTPLRALFPLLLEEHCFSSRYLLPTQVAQSKAVCLPVSESSRHPSLAWTPYPNRRSTFNLFAFISFS